MEGNVVAFVKVEGILVYPSFYDYSTYEQIELKVWVDKAIDETIITAKYKMMFIQDEE